MWDSEKGRTWAVSFFNLMHKERLKGKERLNAEILFIFIIWYSKRKDQFLLAPGSNWWCQGSKNIDFNLTGIMWGCHTAEQRIDLSFFLSFFLAFFLASFLQREWLTHWITHCQRCRSCGVYLSQWSSQLAFEKEIWMTLKTQPFYKLSIWNFSFLVTLSYNLGVM